MAQFDCKHKIYTNNDSGPRNTASLKWIIIHTTENTGNTTGMDVARYQQSPSAGGSYNMLVDKFRNSVRSNDDNYVPWAAGSWAANSQGLHISVVGQAAQTREQWLGEYLPALETLADIVAHSSREYGIPLVRRSSADLRNGVKGIAGHNECSQAFGGSDHWDPGPNFPYDRLIAMAEQRLNPSTKPEVDVSQQDRVHHELTHRFQSRVEGSTYRDTVAGFVLNTDAATHRTEVAMAEVLDRLDRIEQALEAQK